MSPNYGKGKIYTICSHSNKALIYVGCTTKSLAKRFGEHKYSTGTSLYKYIDNPEHKTTWADWYIELYEVCPCDTKEQLNKREMEVIREISTINKHGFYDDQKAYRKANHKKIAEQEKAYREANRDKIAEQRKAYREANRDKIAERKKAYREANHDKIAEQKKAYREANRDKIAEQKKAYYAANRDELLEYQKKTYREKKNLKAK
jgi:hypothetical protein